MNKKELIDLIRSKKQVYSNHSIFNDYEYYSNEIDFLLEEQESLYSKTRASKYVLFKDINFKIDNWSFDYGLSVTVEVEDNLDELIDKLYQYALDTGITNTKALAILKKISSKPYVMGDWYVQTCGIAGFGEYSVLLCRYSYGFVDYICKELDADTANCLKKIYLDFTHELEEELTSLIVNRMESIDDYYYSADRYIDILECLDLEDEKIEDIYQEIK
jgi:hypothetical protein